MGNADGDIERENGIYELKEIYRIAEDLVLFLIVHVKEFVAGGDHFLELVIEQFEKLLGESSQQSITPDFDSEKLMESTIYLQDAKKTTWTYNPGVIGSGLAALAVATGNPTHTLPAGRDNLPCDDPAAGLYELVRKSSSVIVHAAHMRGVNNCSSDREKARTQAAQAMPCPAEDAILLGPKLGFKQHKGKLKKAAVPSGEDSKGIPELAAARMVADDPLRSGEQNEPTKSRNGQELVERELREENRAASAIRK
ncbi:hypothetical protein FB451DRAFT_1169044 [Mycena latifolia]|nr:hypothetical protein FB451DRAFT_1169044 [Mycena latifolia]